MTLSAVSSVLCALAPGGTTRSAVARAAREHADWHFHRSRTCSKATFLEYREVAFCNSGVVSCFLDGCSRLGGSVPVSSWGVCSREASTNAPVVTVVV